MGCSAWPKSVPHAIREALSMQLGRHRDGMLRVAEERSTPVEVGHVVQGDDV